MNVKGKHMNGMHMREGSESGKPTSTRENWNGNRRSTYLNLNLNLNKLLFCYIIIQLNSVM